MRTFLVAASLLVALFATPLAAAETLHADSTPVDVPEPKVFPHCNYNEPYRSLCNEVMGYVNCAEAQPNAIWIVWYCVL